MKIGFCIYAKDSAAAVSLYLRAFGAQLGYHVPYAEGGYLHAEIVKNGQTVLAVSGNEEWAGESSSMQFCVNFGAENQADLERAYAALSENGRVRYPLGPCDWNACMADVTDAFGIRWYLAL